MKRLLLATLVACLPAFATASEVPALKQISVFAPQHEKSMEVSIWYPGTGGTVAKFGGNKVFEGVEVAQDATVDEGLHPIVLLSHGIGGNFRSLAWLSAGLAARGAIVIAVNHPNSTTFDFDLKRSLDHWTRVADLQVALDAAGKDPMFAGKLDRSRIYAAGFSYGAWTALSIGGLRANLAAYTAHCTSADPLGSQCGGEGALGLQLRGALLARADAGPAELDKWNASYKDLRVTKVVAIDAPFTWGLTSLETKDLVKDVLLIGLGAGADRMPATNTGESGSGFNNLLPDARVDVIAPAAHFTGLLTCTPAGAAILADESDDPVCTDPVGTDRIAVHAKIVGDIAQFFGLK